MFQTDCGGLYVAVGGLLEHNGGLRHVARATRDDISHKEVLEYGGKRIGANVGLREEVRRRVNGCEVNFVNDGEVRCNV